MLYNNKISLDRATVSKPNRVLFETNAHVDLYSIAKKIQGLPETQVVNLTVGELKALGLMTYDESSLLSIVEELENSLADSDREQDHLERDLEALQEQVDNLQEELRQSLDEKIELQQELDECNSKSANR